MSEEVKAPCGPKVVSKRESGMRQGGREASSHSLSPTRGKEGIGKEPWGQFPEEEGVSGWKFGLP